MVATVRTSLVHVNSRNAQDIRTFPVPPLLLPTSHQPALGSRGLLIVAFPACVVMFIDVRF